MTRWTEADVRAVQARSTTPMLSAGAVKKAHKYKAQGVWIDNIHFPSKLEGRCYVVQKLRQAAGEILFFLRQTPWHLEGGVVYRSDFMCFFPAGGFEVIDAKGVDTPDGRNKRKQVKARYGVDVLLWSDKKR